MFRHFRMFIAITLIALSAQSASAHFLWVVVEKQKDSSAAKVYFSEVAEPDDPALLEKFAKLEGWAVSGGRGEPQSLSFRKGEDCLQADLNERDATSPIVLRHQYGVISRGGETFLLNYYAKAYSTPLPGTWKAIDSKERLPLEIVPVSLGSSNGVKLQVLWNGEPVKGATVAVHGPRVTVDGVTDEKGNYQCELPEAGVFAIRARHMESIAGELDGQKYSSIRHYSTLTLPYVPATLSSRANVLPDLPKPTTSFGGAILGNNLYVYGGNYGDAHEYSNEGQSGDMWKLDLKTPAKWEHVMTGPKLQGLAMIEHQGVLYRIGGFTALNKANDEQNLKSQTDFARFDLDKRTWEQLPALPQPRSSHDAAMLGNHLYVVGGWALRGGDQESEWHTSALRMDLGASKLEWSEIASPPFKRRAVAVAAWNGKLYCIGGMQEKGGTTTATAVYEPSSNTWSTGPSLLGTGMDGFGASAFAAKDRLYVTTMSGSIQRLSADGQKWEFLGQVAHPRFFHRLLPWQDQNLVVVGGAHMAVGKIEPIEVIEVP